MEQPRAAPDLVRARPARSSGSGRLTAVTNVFRRTLRWSRRPTSLGLRWKQIGGRSSSYSASESHFPDTDERTLIAVSSRYEYLADGDVLGFDHSSRKFRTLFRRNSAHNSFLVTERCNNYCLMCSQPPKDVDDRWILSEIKESLSLIDPTTHALTFTGGETLSDWEDFIGVLKQCRHQLARTSVQVLTNGRAFADCRLWTPGETSNIRS